MMNTYRLDQDALQTKFETITGSLASSDMDMTRSLMEDMTNVLEFALNHRDDDALKETLLGMSAKAMAWRDSLDGSSYPTPKLSVVR